MERIASSRIETVAMPWLRSGLFWIVLFLIGMMAFFWDGILRVLQGWTRPEYSFGPLVPVVSAYMLLHELRERPPVSDGGSRIPGLLVVGLGILIGFAGNLTQISHVIAYGMLVLIGGLVLIIAGARQGLTYWPGWVHLSFMLPLPSLVYFSISGYLQLISSKIGVAIVQAAGIPVYLSGNIIDLGIYQLHVAEACSGLRYLFPLMSFGYLFAVLYRGPLWQKFTLFFLAIPITVLMNSIRIGIIGILVNYYGIAQAEGFLHWFEGWIIFVACTVLLYVAGLILQRLRAKPESALNILDLDFDRLFVPFTWLRDMAANRTLVGATLVVLAFGALWQLTPSRADAVIERQDFQLFPMSINTWQGRPDRFDEEILTALGADDHLLADFTSPNSRSPINLFIGYYYSITDGTDTHAPERCIPGNGWEVQRWQSIPIKASQNVEPFALNRTIIQKGNDRQLVYYWYEQRGHRLSSEYASKFNTVVDAALLGRSDGALVRLTTPLAPGESEVTADERLQAFLRALVPILPEYLPR